MNVNKARGRAFKWLYCLDKMSRQHYLEERQC